MVFSGVASGQQKRKTADLGLPFWCFLAGLLSWGKERRPDSLERRLGGDWGAEIPSLANESGQSERFLSLIRQTGGRSTGGRNRCRMFRDLHCYILQSHDGCK